MQTDIMLEQATERRRIIIDTKFTAIFTQSVWKTTVLDSGYLYQMYAYLRSQVHSDDPLSACSEGILLHPAVDGMVDECLAMQGHTLRFMTVDLFAATRDIVQQLRQLVVPSLQLGPPSRAPT